MVKALEYDVMAISIHALAKRATRITDCVKHVNAYFNPRPRKEGDGAYLLPQILYKDFNPRPRKEGD